MFKTIWNVLTQMHESLQAAREAAILSRSRNPEQIARYFNQAQGQ
jgi:hypothetical protein